MVDHGAGKVVNAYVVEMGAFLVGTSDLFVKERKCYQETLVAVLGKECLDALVAFEHDTQHVADVVMHAEHLEEPA